MMDKLFIFSLLWIACTSVNPDISHELKEAARFQNEALKIHHSLDSLLTQNEAMVEPELRQELKQLRESMIEIPQIPHDHRYCNGQHNHRKMVVSDSTMRNIQKEWRDSMIAIEERIKKE